MKVAVMQPYVFPYIGYFQLIKAVDKFIFYDDVNFIKGGWINRNNILINKNKSLFTIPLDKASPFVAINQTIINSNFYENWKLKFLKSIEQSYKKAPFFEETYSVVEKILNKKFEKISDLAICSIIEISEYLKINTQFEISSERYPLTGEVDKLDRLVSICKINKADNYINPIGGMELYSKTDFLKNDIILNFIKANPITYTQLNNEFVPWLSIIDVIMFNSIEEISELLDKYELV